MGEPTQPVWVAPGRCDFCPREADLHQCVCVCGHLVGVNACGDKHLDLLREGEMLCRACAYDLAPGKRHVCALTPTGEPARVADPRPGLSIRCPQCGQVSYNRNDVAHRYCGNCHQFHDQMLLDGPEPG